MSKGCTSIPIIDFIHLHPIGSIIIAVALLIISVISLPIWHFTEPNKQIRDQSWRKIRWIFSTGLPITGYALFSLLLTVILVRPVWCPIEICLPPRFIPITNSQGNHDSNLEIYFVTTQAPSFVLLQDPTEYTSKILPRSDDPSSISALQIDKPVSYPYRLVFSAHNLHSGPFSMFIEQVTLYVKQVPATPYPLNVWVNSPTLEYDSNVFQVIYRGQPAGAILSASYIHSPHLHVQLAPGETDTLDLEVKSTVAAFIQFQVQVQYRLANESEMHTLTLPGNFQAVFAETSNWHPYHLQNEKLIAGA